MNKLGIIGVGRMGGALIQGLTSHTSLIIQAFDHDMKRLDEFSGVLPAQSLEEACDADVVVLAIKPQSFRELTLKRPVKAKGVISIMTGISLSALRHLFPTQEVVRAMPNTPLMVQQGLTGLYGTSLSEAFKALCEAVFKAVGSILWVESESALDKLTAVSGSGPAYVFYMMEAMIQGAVSLGFSLEDSRTMVLNTVFGASLLALKADRPIEALRAQVTSKGGTTEAAIQALEAGLLQPVIIQALHQAYERAKALGAPS